MKFEQFTEIYDEKEFPIVINLECIIFFHSDVESPRRVRLFTDNRMIVIKENFDNLSRRLQQL